MIRAKPFIANHTRSPMVRVGANVQVGAMEGFNPVLDVVGLITGPCLKPGECDGCHVKDAHQEVWATPKFTCESQVFAKAGIMLAGGVAGFFYMGWWTALAGAVAGNLLARPIVDAYAKSSGPAALDVASMPSTSKTPQGILMAKGSK